MWPDHVVERFQPVMFRRGKWHCRCPAHDDRTPSFAIWLNEAEDRLLIRCLAGCDKHSILSSVGLTMKNLFRHTAYGIDQDAPPPRREVCRYIYRDANCRPVHAKIRYLPKSFSQAHHDGTSWRSGLGNVTTIPYNLDRLAANPEALVWFVEGEKDAETLTSLGLLATTTTDGACNGWDSPHYPQFFSSREVCLVPDLDRIGQRHAALVAGALMLWSHDISLRIVQLPDCGGSVKDVTDFVLYKGKRNAAACLDNLRLNTALWSSQPSHRNPS